MFKKENSNNYILFILNAAYNKVLQRILKRKESNYNLNIFMFLN